MDQKPSILAVDDDLTARTFISQTLSSLAVNVCVTANCREFSEMIGKSSADLYLIDVELPDGDGFLMADGLRRRSHSPVVFLSVHADDNHKFRALELGAVEYLSKPIHPREFSLRIQNILSSSGNHQADRAVSPSASQISQATTRRFGDLNFDVLRRRLIDGNGCQIVLPPSEFEVLALLTDEPHRVVTRHEIAQRLGPQSAARHNARIVDILIWRLRKKMQSASPCFRFIATVPSRGYVFVESVLPG